jgi:hypothetical protein
MVESSGSKVYGPRAGARARKIRSSFLRKLEQRANEMKQHLCRADRSLPTGRGTSPWSRCLRGFPSAQEECIALGYVQRQVGFQKVAALGSATPHPHAGDAFRHISDPSAQACRACHRCRGPVRRLPVGDVCLFRRPPWHGPCRALRQHALARPRTLRRHRR